MVSAYDDELVISSIERIAAGCCVPARSVGIASADPREGGLVGGGGGAPGAETGGGRGADDGGGGAATEGLDGAGRSFASGVGVLEYL